MFPACRTAKLITSLAFRSRASRKSRHGQTNYQHQCQRISPGELFTHLRDLLGSLLTSGSKKAYQRAWRSFQIFYDRFYWPVSSPQLALFISYLSAKKLAPSTITSYLSAISYVHKIKAYTDPTNKSFLIHKLLTAVSRQRLADLRLPFTRPVLHELIESLQHTTSSAFQRCLYSAMFLLAFYNFFRVGELAAKRGDCADYRAQPQAGTGHKMQFVPFVFSKSCFQGPAFRCDQIVVIAGSRRARNLVCTPYLDFGGKSLDKSS